jgi:hypothetical protein
MSTSNNQSSIAILKIEEELLIELFSGLEYEKFTFKIELLKCLKSGLFYGRVYRQDSFRLKLLESRSEQLPSGEANHELWVIDDFFQADDLTGEILDELRARIIRKIEDTFFIT